MRDSRGVDRARLWLQAVPILLLMTGASPAAGQPTATGPIDLSGTWSLDTYLSDHSEQIARAIRIDSGESAPETIARGTEPAETNWEYRTHGSGARNAGESPETRRIQAACRSGAPGPLSTPDADDRPG